MGSIWMGFKEIIFELLKIIESYVGDWGLAIIVLTILVRAALMPLTIKQTRSMYELQRIQPKIKELQKKYADDKEKLQEETLKFYQENKVNPFGGCLPLLLQMPLLIALYQVLGGTAKHPGLLMTFLAEQGTVGSFYGVIPNIAMTPASVFATQGFLPALPYILLVAIFGISVWLPQALMPGGDSSQKTTSAVMAVMMLFFGWSAPAGVLLYWDLSSIWGLTQQQVQIAMLKRHDHADEEIVVDKPKAKSSKQKNTKKS